MINTPKGIPADSPFHLRGYIGPQHKEAWAAMKRHDDILASVVRDLDYNPPEYVLVRAPAFGGKTTFALQLVHGLAESRPDILMVYVPVGGTNASLAGFLGAVRDGLKSRLTEWLNANGAIEQKYPGLRDELSSWEKIRASSLSQLLDKVLFEVPDEFARIVFVADDCDALPPELRESIAEELRSIYVGRQYGSLSRFSVVLLARSLLHYPSAVSPLADIVREYSLGDFSLEDTELFLSRCGALLDGLTFDPDAVRYLHRKTGGQAVAIQRVCSIATRNKANASIVETSDILDGICDCFETRGGFVERILDIESLSDEAKGTLNHLLRGNIVLPFEFDPAVGQLMDLGIAKITNQKRCTCRSPLVLELLVYRYLTAQDRPRLNSNESCLLDLPQVKPLLCDDLLFDEICSLHPSNHAGFTSGEPEACVKELIHRRHPEIDVAAIQHCARRYFDDPQAPVLEDVLRVVAKVYLHWWKQQC
jgi:hypothetical protein